MATHHKPSKGENIAPSPGGAAADQAALEEALKPFQEAAAKFLQASTAAQQAAAKQSAQQWLDYQDQVRQAEQQAYKAVSHATRKQLDKVSEKSKADKPEEAYSAQAQAQADYEKEIQQIYSDTQSKLSEIAQKTFGEKGEAGSLLKQVTDQRQNAYQAYLSDLQSAWGGVKNADPQTISAIASTILYTINAAGQ